MDQLEEKFTHLFKNKVVQDEKEFEKIYRAFKEICYELDLEKRKDISFFSIILEVDGEIYLSLYYQLILTSDGSSTDTSSKITINFLPISEEDRETLGEASVFERDLELDPAFKELEELALFKRIQNMKFIKY